MKNCSHINCKIKHCNYYTPRVKKTMIDKNSCEHFKKEHNEYEIYSKNSEDNTG